MTVNDIEGIYTIPYIQSQRSLDFALDFGGIAVEKTRVTLRLGDTEVGVREAVAPDFCVHFPDLACGEYSFEAEGLGKDGQRLCRSVYERVGVGVVVAAMGDSITEGYFSHGFMIEDRKLAAERFPSEVVSKDGRNFPQFSPTTHVHLPSVNCFESWMTALNDLLSETWKSPVFIANEGWGGITSGEYLRRVQTDAGWRARMGLLRPTVWLIHLGVNDERAKVPAEQFASNMRALVDALVQNYGANPDRIFIAKPCFDYFEGAAEILTAYGVAIDALVADRSVSPGADFFSAYAQDRERWYGADPVHPNIEGMKRMAELWRDALVQRFPEGIAP
ncbi:MAG: hydro protein [Candidatus Hydrogenedentes bacterium]|nr:hydro protein [Candidatus Hydrogenedentota bacterium]